MIVGVIFAIYDWSDESRNLGQYLKNAYPCGSSDITLVHFASTAIQWRRRCGSQPAALPAGCAALGRTFYSPLPKTLHP
jgi:hypothetical protein